MSKFAAYSTIISCWPDPLQAATSCVFCCCYMLACHQPQRHRRFDRKPLHLLPQLKEEQQDVGVQLLPPAPLLVVHV
jgi:hypothetical protein